MEFKSEDDAEYAARIMNQVRLFGKPIRVNKVRIEFICAFVMEGKLTESLGFGRQAKDGRDWCGASCSKLGSHGRREDAL